MSTTEQGGDNEQSFLSHLIELRSRLLKAVAAVLVVLVALIPLANRLYAWLAKPLLEHLPAGGAMIATDVASPFFAPLKLAFFVALFLAMPFILFQIWSFVSPGLYKHERRLALPLLASSVLLFYIGCAFAYFLVLPAIFTFMTSVAPAGVAVMPDISRFLDFALVLFLSFGFCFEVPVALVILVAIGVTSPEQLVKGRPYAIVGAFVIAAVLTPPDVISQLLLAVPMCLLYEVGIVAARFVTRRDPHEKGSPAG
ncbi:MAG TPA: twin-arginine translocase subunit TatC [Dokdonella sp.]|uniref:twin-arginine translocase subunit TatC n=1 Tax=Dokdonella sp. TaxID=2291710 RepID=UPI002C932F9B|nr:twin-arginine translocase subunit TatC [Dokdonella sp.]HOX71520.1 twin-arginine translocase subunit TatC [Dokdonella sp.]HPG94291.1 twin-arginine translocase subunit TatC [Dokdonella sp.]